MKTVQTKCIKFGPSVNREPYPHLSDPEFDAVIASWSEDAPSISVELNLAIIEAFISRLASKMDLNRRVAA